jgi:hypothetical protein
MYSAGLSSSAELAGTPKDEGPEAEFVESEPVAVFFSNRLVRLYRQSILRFYGLVLDSDLLGTRKALRSPCDIAHLAGRTGSGSG